MTFQTFTRTDTGELTPGAAERFTFPAGEQHIKYPNLESLTGNQYAYVRGTNAEDYIALRMWADTVRAAGGTPSAAIPYLPAARADRGVPFGANVYADLINAANLAQVVCFDPHSPVMPSLIDNITEVSAANLIAETLREYPAADPYAGIVAPDHGAIARAKEAAHQLGLPVYQAAKHRDEATGKLSGFTCEPLPDTGTFLVVDDICDGGGTFLGLADATGLDANRLHLWVSHGVFSRGAPRLQGRYGRVYSTDSINPVSDYRPNITVPLFNHITAHFTEGV